MIFNIYNKYIFGFKKKDINYLSRDIIFLALDGRYRYYGKAIQEFLKEYFYSTSNPHSTLIKIIK